MTSATIAPRQTGSIRISTVLITGSLRLGRTDRLYSVHLNTPRRRKCPGRDPVWTNPTPAYEPLRYPEPADGPAWAPKIDIEIP
jgi:hypothetical protein